MEGATAKRGGASTLVLDTLEFEAWRNFIRSNARLMRELDDELRECQDFALGDYDVLIQLSRAPQRRRRMCDLADAVLLSPSGLSRRVERLERAGLVKRERAESDARIIETRLTPAGARRLRQLTETHLAGVRERFLDRFTPAELASLRDLLARLVPADADGQPPTAPQTS